MTPKAATFFADTGLVARIERAEGELIRAGAEAVRRRNPEAGVLTVPVAGGVAVWAERDSPLNKVAGLGFAGAPEEGELDALERVFDERSTPVRVELASLAEPEVAARLARRGYLFAGFENVLGLRSEIGSLHRCPRALRSRRAGWRNLTSGWTSWSPASPIRTTRAYRRTRSFRARCSSG